jgi:hypothetical protein
MVIPLVVAAAAEKILAALRSSLTADSVKIQAFAKIEANHLAQVLADIARETASGQITPQEAKSLLQIQRLAAQNMLLANEGLGVVAVDNALTAAFGAVKDAVNTAAGVAIL